MSAWMQQAVYCLHVVWVCVCFAACVTESDFHLTSIFIDKSGGWFIYCTLTLEHHLHYCNGRVELNTFYITTAGALMFGLITVGCRPFWQMNLACATVEVIQSHNASLKLVMTQLLGKK